MQIGRRIKAWLTLIGGLCLVATAAPAHVDTGAEPAPTPTARQAADAMGRGFNLGQMFDNPQHPPTLAAARPKIDAYYAMGFRVVRIPVTWTEAIDGSTLADPETGGINPDSTRLAALEAVIDYALTLPGMYVVINAHHETRLKDGLRADVLERLWADVSARLRDRDHRLIYELLNEPHLSNREAMPPAAVREMSGRAYRQIRARDPNRIIVIGGNQWFAAHEMALTWPHLDDVGGGRDPYLMATFHHYDPWTFSGDGQGDYADPWTEVDLRTPMTVMSEWATTTGRGMPVFIGEWGVGWQSRYDVMDCNNIRLWYARFVRGHAEPLGMPTAVWDDGGWFGIFDHARNAFGNDLADCITGDCAWSGTERFNAGCL